MLLSASEMAFRCSLMKIILPVLCSLASAFPPLAAPPFFGPGFFEPAAFFFEPRQCSDTSPDDTLPAPARPGTMVGSSSS